jgi:hypothetical protein
MIKAPWRRTDAGEVPFVNRSVWWFTVASIQSSGNNYVLDGICAVFKLGNDRVPQGREADKYADTDERHEKQVFSRDDTASQPVSTYRFPVLRDHLWLLYSFRRGSAMGLKLLFRDM